MELSKKDKRVAREVIEKGLQREFSRGLFEADTVLHKWKNTGFEDNRTAYHTLFKTVRDFDRHIARRYDGIKNADLLDIILAQLVEGVIDENDLEGFTEETRQALKEWKERRTAR
jgi:hypothetical protein